MDIYSVEKLFQAFNILEGQDHAAFQRFVQREKMPTEDVERVLNKYNYIHNTDFKRKIDKMIKNIKEKLEKGESGFVSPF